MSLDESGVGRIARVEFTGTRSDLFGLLTRGYLLMVPTLGIYRFWLVTDVRRFFSCGHAARFHLGSCG